MNNDKTKPIFKGFTAGKHNNIEIPEQFFRDVLPIIENLAELKVILFCWRGLFQKSGEFRYLRYADFANDDALRQGLAAIDADTESLLNSALAQAVADGVLLVAEVELDTKPERLYFVNTAKGRKAIEQIKAGNWQPDEANAIEILPERPTIFSLYEENIGPLTSGIVDRLKAAEDDYPYHWIVEAINIAIDNNVRRWKYITAILDSWKQEGRVDENTTRISRGNVKKYAVGKWAKFFES